MVFRFLSSGASLFALLLGIANSGYIPQSGSERYRGEFMSTPSSISPVPTKKARWKKIAAGILSAIFVLWIGLVAFIWRAMHKTPEDFARVMSHMPWEIFLAVPFETMWTRARAGDLNIGDSAPDFSLLKLDKTATIHFSEINKTQPVVMVFGSYT